MNFKALTLAAVVAAGIAAQPAFAQDTAGDEVASNGTSFRGVRVEGNVGGDRFQSQNDHNDKFGYGGTVGFDGTIGQRIVIGAEGSYWNPGKGNENCNAVTGGSTLCHKAFEEWGVAARAGVLATPQLLVFGKAGYVNSEQRVRLDGPVSTLAYDHDNIGGYQVGGGVEYTVMPQGRMPVYVNAQYVYSNYDNNTSRQRVMAGVGIRFK